MANELTTLFLFRQHAGLSADATRDALLERLITDVSAAIGSACNRTFGATTYKAWIDGTGEWYLRLPQWPVTNIYQICTDTDTACTIEYTGSGEYADLSFDGTTVTLHSVGTDGVETTSTLAVATYKTVTTLAAAIAAVSGWSATVETDMGTFPSALIRPIMAADVLTTSSYDLEVPTDPVAGVRLAQDTNRLVEAEDLETWPEGSQNVFVWYKAGYTLPVDDGTHESLQTAGNVPGGLVLAANECVYDAWNATRLDGNVSSESIGGHNYVLGGASYNTRSVVDRRWQQLAQYADKWV